MGEFSFIALLDAQSKKFLMPRAFPSMLYFHLGHPTTRSLSDALSLQPMFFALSDLKRWSLRRQVFHFLQVLHFQRLIEPG
jgi:hypothetical protein